MTTYNAPVEEMMFLFNNLKDNKNYNEIEKFKEINSDLVKDILDQAAKINQEIVHPLAKIGDVYYCTTSNNVTVTAKKVHRHREERFTFKRTGKKLIFGSTGLFKDLTLDRELDFGKEGFVYQTPNQTFFHRPSGFTFTSHDPESAGLDVVIGSCSVFK